jgi:signal transduction histidine kinase
LQNGVIAITRDRRMAVINEAAYRVLGVTPKPGDIGRPVEEVLAQVPEVARLLSQAFELNHLPNRAEMRLADGGRTIGFTLSLIREHDDEPTGAALFFKDLTRVEQLEERERLRDRLAALGEMAAAIAHEVKNPLGGIEVMAGLLKRRLTDRPDAQMMLNDIIKEAKMANAIVLEVLEFVRPLRLHAEPVEIARLVEDAMYVADSQVPRGRTEVTLSMAPDTPTIEADAQQLRQLVTNLLTNAFEAVGADEGRVEVRVRAARAGDPVTSAERERSALVLEVADNGPGVPPESRERIFSPFFTTKPRGSGLGLAIVRKIVDAHEGRIDVSEGLQERGACFRVLLPLGPATT